VIEQGKKEVERRLDKDGKQFLEVLVGLEREVSRLNKQNEKLKEERGLAQAKMAKQERDFERQLGEVERHRDHILNVMTEEGRELQSRVEKLSSDNQKISQDNETLTTDFVKAKAQADMLAALSPPPSSELSAESSMQMRTLAAELEAIKDDCTDKEGQITLLQSQVEIKDRKLKLTDSENAVLKKDASTLDAKNKELQARVDELSQTLEKMNRDSGGGGGATASSSQGGVDNDAYRTLLKERDELKDTIVDKEEELMVAQTNLEIAERKLTLTEIENKKLKREVNNLKGLSVPGSTDSIGR
jgi:chromosome segregation ATPase